MTAGERAVWAAVYAAHVHSPQLPGFDQATPERVTQAAARAASVAITMLREYAAESDHSPNDLAFNHAREALR